MALAGADQAGVNTAFAPNVSCIANQVGAPTGDAPATWANEAGAIARHPALHE
jgi:hypothetical protein